MANNLTAFTNQQSTLSAFIDKGAAIVDGTGYDGAAPSYASMLVDITELTSAVFKSSDIYRPNTNIGYKEMFDTVVSNNRFADSIGYSRADYYTMAGAELVTLKGLQTYTQNVITKLIEVPTT